MRVVGGEEADSLAVHRAEARRRVGDLLADDRGDRPGEDADPDPPAERGAERTVAGEAGADDDVGLVVEQRAQDLRQLRRVVLAVPVDLHREVVAPLEGEAEAGLHRPADPEVEGELEDVGALLARDRGCAVDRAVVHDDDVEAGVEGAELVDDAGDRLLLVECGDDREPALLARPGTAGAAARTSSATGRDRLLGADPDQVEQSLRPLGVGVLVEDALAGATAELLGGAGSSSSSR